MWRSQESTSPSAALGGEGLRVPPRWCRVRGCAARESPGWVLAALIAALSWTPAGQLAAQTLTTLHAFSAIGFPYADGADPFAGLILSGDTLYGTARSGGGNPGYGTLFSVKTDGTGFTTLYSFTDGSDGADPQAGLILSGNTLYGTALNGGSSGAGTVFRVNTDGTGFTTLHSFSGGSDGEIPYAGLILSGNTLYGTTDPAFYGHNGNGTVFSVNTDGTGFTTLHAFTGGSDGADPSAGLVLSGNTLYGTASGGDSPFGGTVFSVNTDGTGFTTLHAFTVFSDGLTPEARLVLSGNILYGTTWYGGSSGYGTVFSVNADGTGFTTLYSLNGGSDGGNPSAGLVLSSNTLYGTASGGGSSGYGTVFRVNTDGTGFTTLHSLTGGSDGATPEAGLVLSGNTLYGTASGGGSSSGGTVFSVNTDGTGFTTLHGFSGVPLHSNADGADPEAGLVLSGKTLYGTAEHGGSYNAGTVFTLKTDGTGFTTLHSFTGGSDGAEPRAGLVLSGNALYGTASGGGSSGWGTVFSVNTNGTGFTNLHSFTGGSDGANPLAGLVLSGNTLYGTASGGGSSGKGTVFRVNTDGTGFTNLHSFTEGSDGANPLAGLTLSGNTLYGTASSDSSWYERTPAWGTVFRVNTDGTGFTNLYNFTGGGGGDPVGDGGNPYAGLVLSGNTLYGTEPSGGPWYDGTVFKVNTDGTGYATLHGFNGWFDGFTPEAALVLSDTTLYGTTYEGGGIPLAGTVFSVNTDGTGFTVLHSFTRGSDGAWPDGALVLSGKTLYGTASIGGSSGNGTVFSLSLLPQLAIIPSETNLILTWPAYATGFTLQFTTNLVSPATWTTVSPGPVIVSGLNTVTNPIAGVQQFYRLSQ